MNRQGYKSLPAGINEDESDPMGPSRGTPQRTSAKGRMTPRFRGGALSSFSPARIRSEPRRFKAANHSGMRDIKEGGFAAFLVIFNTTPPLSVWQTFRGTVA